MSRTIRVLLALAAMGALNALAPITASAQADCVTATVTQQEPRGGFLVGDPSRVMWVPGNTNTWRVVGFWTNWPGVDQGERKLDLLAPGQYVELLGGGTVSEWPAQCERQARDGWDNNPLPYVSIAQLGADEWLCCDSRVVSQWDAYWRSTQDTAAALGVGFKLDLTHLLDEECPPARELVFHERTTIELPGPTILHPWWNNGKTGWGQDPGRTIINRGERPTFVEVLGRAWLYNDTDACQANLEGEFNNAPQLANRQLADLRSRGLAR